MTTGSERLGQLIRRQREMSELSVRRLAAMVGISNPYLSQIERGLRTPSARVLEAIAAQLDLSAATLTELTRSDGEFAPGDGSAMHVAIAEDPNLTPEQRRALRTVYEAFRRQANR